jgi:fructose-1,6-bisphosphatase/sedoheptulose 1,7-bisphosphatase-like protein
MGIRDPNKVYDTDDLAPGKKIIFAATGVTDGALLKGVRFFGSGKRTHSVVMTTESRTSVLSTRCTSKAGQTP